MKLFYPLFFLFISSLNYAENTKKVYYSVSKTNNFRFIKSDAASADYYAIEEKEINSNHSLKTFYSLNGNKEFFCSFLNDTLPDGLFISYYPTGIVSDSGYYNKGEKKSNWYYYHANGQLASQVRYKDGQMGFIQCFDENGKADTSCVPEIMAIFPGGSLGLAKFLSYNIQIPLEVKSSGVTGEVVVRFFIDTDGSVRNPEVVTNQVGRGCDNEAIRVVNLMPKWTPAKLYNRKIKVYYMLPIAFRPSN